MTSPGELLQWVQIGISIFTIVGGAFWLGMFGGMVKTKLEGLDARLSKLEARGD